MDRMERRIANRWEEMPDIVAMVERFGAEHACPGQVINDVNVVLDEVLSNIISYGYEDGEQSDILVRLDYRPGEVLVEVEDAGKPFDPLKAPPPDLGVPLEARQVGGLGIHFIKSLMDDVAYARVDGKNRLRLRKKLPPGNSA
jgi:anti-sigma regulatory factor (Ser/Thr protein kinase)